MTLSSDGARRPALRVGGIHARRRSLLAIGKVSRERARSLLADLHAQLGAPSDVDRQVEALVRMGGDALQVWGPFVAEHVPEGGTLRCPNCDGAGLNIVQVAPEHVSFDACDTCSRWWFETARENARHGAKILGVAIPPLHTYPGAGLLDRNLVVALLQTYVQYPDERRPGPTPQRSPRR